MNYKKLRDFNYRLQINIPLESRIVIVFMWFCSFILITGCDNQKESIAQNGEGVVNYKITYLENNPYSNFMILPNETNLVFKDKRASFVTSAMGVVQIVNILDFEKKEYTSLLINMFGENYAFTEKPEDIKELETNPEYLITPTEETKLIAGLECKKAIVKDKTNNTEFDIYYYEKIKVYLGDCPYKDFNYLLMEYQDVKQGMTIRLKAEKVDFSPVDTTLLNVRGDFTWVDRKTFINVIENLKVPR